MRQGISAEYVRFKNRAKNSKGSAVFPVAGTLEMLKRQVQSRKYISGFLSGVFETPGAV